MNPVQFMQLLAFRLECFIEWMTDPKGWGSTGFGEDGESIDRAAFEEFFQQKLHAATVPAEGPKLIVPEGQLHIPGT